MKKTIVLGLAALMFSSMAHGLATQMLSKATTGQPGRYKQVIEAQPYAVQFLIDGESSQETAAVLARIRMEIPEVQELGDLELSQWIVSIPAQPAK